MVSTTVISATPLRIRWAILIAASGKGMSFAPIRK